MPKLISSAQVVPGAIYPYSTASWPKTPFSPSNFRYSVKIVHCLERVAEKLRHGTRDLGVWGSIMRCRSDVKALGKLRIHIASGHPAVMGTWCTNSRLDRKLQLRFMLSSPGGKVNDEYCIDIWTLNKHLYLYLWSS